jgi:hypothetical protein
MTGVRGSNGGNKDRDKDNETDTTASPDNRAAVGAAIIAYIKAHPDAADNAIGIKRWWLPRHLANVSAADVATVLAALVADGLLQTQRLPGGHVIFGGIRVHNSRH